MAKRGHNVTIITTDFKFDNEYAESMRSVEIIPFKILVDFQSFFYTPSMNQWLHHNIKNYDIIHCHDVRSFQNILVFKYAKKFQIPYILQAHGTVSNIVGKKRLKELYDLLCGNKFINNSSKCVAVSPLEVEQYKQVVPNKNIELIPNALDLSEFSDLPNVGTFRQQLNINEKTNLILFLGRVHKMKCIDFLIKSFFLLTREFSNSILVIVGPDRGYKEKLENLVLELGIQSRVKFVGFIEDKKRAYVDADVVVYPSIYEIFGLVPFEAILCDTPVIVSEGSGCGELIENAKCGCLVKFPDTVDLCSKIKYLLENPNEGDKMTSNGQNYIKSNLTWDGTIKKFEELYLKVLIKP